MQKIWGLQWQPPTNTKTKLDLTKAFRDLSQTPYSDCKVKHKFADAQIFYILFSILIHFLHLYGPVYQKRVENNHSSHRFYNRYCTRQNARVVAALCGVGERMAFGIDRLLRTQ